jgi:hypothetical protein
LVQETRFHLDWKTLGSRREVIEDIASFELLDVQTKSCHSFLLVSREQTSICVEDLKNLAVIGNDGGTRMSKPKRGIAIPIRVTNGRIPRVNAAIHIEPRLDVGASRRSSLEHRSRNGGPDLIDARLLPLAQHVGWKRSWGLVSDGMAIRAKKNYVAVMSSLLQRHLIQWDVAGTTGRSRDDVRQLPEVYV